jgi:type I restriction enzyme S subunit
MVRLLSRKMKDSGIEWIGEIPEDWDTIKIKNVASIHGRIGYRGYTVDDLVGEGEGAITLSPTNIIGTTLNLDKCSFISWTKYNESPEIMVYPGDIVFVKTASVGKTAFIEDIDEKITINPQFVVFKDIQINNKFLFYSLISTVIQERLKLDLAGGVINTITQNNIYNYKITITNEQEQQRIANFLDKKVAEIDHILEKTRESIEEYKKYKQSIITEAVTKGLNPDVQMKDSGIEWIGEIPEHWDTVKIKHLAAHKEGLFLDGDWIESDIITSEGVRYLTTGNIGEGYFKEQGDGFISEETLKKMNCLIVYPGDLVISRLNKPIGRACLLPYTHDKYVIAVDNVVLRPNPKLYNRLFLKFAMNIDGYSEEANMISRGATMPRISRTLLGNIKLPIPSSDEQQKIANFLDKKVAEIDTTLSQKEKLLSDLEAYKKSLIYECVTGKREVI